MTEPGITVGDVVQIAPDAGCTEQLCGLFAVVGEVKPWGVVADVPLAAGAFAPVRLQHTDFEPTGGAAVWVNA